jgi:hypothetical protein
MNAPRSFDRWWRTVAIAVVVLSLAVGGCWRWLDRQDRLVRAEVHGILERLGHGAGMTIEGVAEGREKPTLDEVVKLVGREPDEPPATNRARSAARWSWTSPLGRYDIYMKFGKDKAGVFRLEGGRTTGL